MRLRAMLFAAVCLSAAVCPAQTKSQSTIVQGQVTVTFSATPVFNANLANAFKLTLTANVTSSTLTNADAGQMIQFELCQDGTGGRTFVAPTNVLNMGTISATANACSVQEFWFDGSNAVAVGPMMSNGAAQASLFAGTAANSFAVGNINGQRIIYNNASAGFEFEFLNSGNGIAGIQILGIDAFESSSTIGGATGHGGLWANSLTHLWAAKNNGGTAYNLVGDTTTQTLTNKILTSPAVTNPTTTGTDNGTETLQNKTLTGAGSGNSVTLLNEQGPLSAVVGTGAFANLYTFTIPANTIQAGKGIRLKVVYQHTTGTASVSYKAVLGSTTIVGPYSSASVNVQSIIGLEVFNNAGVQSAQHGSYDSILDGAPSVIFGPNAFTSSENAANALTLSFQFNVAATDQVTPKHFRVELIQ